MDHYLPGEMLAQIASFLSKRECNSLMRTSKTAYSKLNSFRNLLPKADLNVDILMVNGNVSFYSWRYKLPDQPHQPKWWVACVSSPGDSKADETKQRAKLLSFFKVYTGETPIKLITIRYQNALALYLDLLLSYFHITFQLQNTNDNAYEEVAIYMRENRRVVPRLFLRLTPLPKSALQLIVDCKPERLAVDAPNLPEGFFQAPFIKKLSHLIVYTYSNMSDDDLLSLNDVYMFTRNALTIITNQGIISFLSEWIVGKREVKIINVRVRWTLSVDAWKAKFAEMNQELVEIHMNKMFIQAKLTRKSDGCALEFRVCGTEIDMRVK